VTDGDRDRVNDKKIIDFYYARSQQNASLDLCSVMARLVQYGTVPFRTRPINIDNILDSDPPALRRRDSKLRGRSLEARQR